MQEILQIFNQSPPPHHQMPPHLQQRLVNVESQFNWSIDSDLSLPGIFDLSDHFQCSEFVKSPFTNFSGSSIDELSKVTAMTEQNGSSKKRKLESDDVEVDSRKQRDEGDAGLVEPEVTTGCCINTRNENSDPQVDLKPDYIHVRARRGQATDSHSLAERARREKIKKKMQFLQDLVPGCHKITNKAAILDEIIDYVQRLQRQAQFLTMKLAASTASVDFKMENALPKEQPVQLSQLR